MCLPWDSNPHALASLAPEASAYTSSAREANNFSLPASLGWIGYHPQNPLPEDFAHPGFYFINRLNFSTIAIGVGLTPRRVAV